MTRREYLAVAVAAQGCRTYDRSSLTVRLTSILGSPTPFVMQSLGLFKNVGLTVRLEQVASSGKIVQALLGGSTDIASVVSRKFAANLFRCSAAARPHCAVNYSNCASSHYSKNIWDTTLAQH